MRVRNWSKFQHYKDGAPKWIKVYKGLLDDRAWHELSGDDAKRLIMVWLIAAERGGELPAIVDLSFRLRLSEKETRSLIARLSQWLEANSSDTLEQVYTDSSLDKNRIEEIRRESMPRKKRGTKCELPADWHPMEELSPDGLLELERFKDHARQNGRRCVDWFAAWRNWQRSPYRKQGSTNGTDRKSRWDTAYSKLADYVQRGEQEGLREGGAEIVRLLPARGG